ncbi:MAG: S8 family serine peptidase [Defluviitaleaceae bacterium]|nr:S8 family serine peptidase [Defluviitaleaceae bacterium]
MPESNDKIGLDETTGKWEVIVRYTGDIMRLEGLLNTGVELLGEGFAILTVRPEDIDKLSTYPEIISVERPKVITQSLYESLREACVFPVQDTGGYGLSGKGVLIAILDSGVDFRHTDFRNADGSSRILYIWDQLDEGTPPSGFHHGREYTNEQLTDALKNNTPLTTNPQLNTLSHGTAVAGAAAGNGSASDGRNKGVATEAGLIVVRLGETGRKSFARTTELMRAIKYSIDKAVGLNMPLCINISYGTNDGPHDGRSLFASYIDAMSQVWKVVFVVAAGNEGAAGHHYMGSLRPGETKDVEFFFSGAQPSAYLTVWKNFTDTMTFELVAPDGGSTGKLSATVQELSVRLGATNVVAQYGQPSHYSPDQNIYFRLEAAQSGGRIAEGLWVLRVVAGEITDGRIDVWLPTNQEVTDKTAFVNPTPDITLTIPSTADGVITVGAYDAALGSIANFSGRGLERDGAVKPDIVAPGVDVLAPMAGGGYDSFTGTSIAAPIVTGCAALMMQWGIVQGNDPFLYGQRAKAFLRLGAQRTPGETYPNGTWGYGRVCLEATMGYLRDYAGKGLKIMEASDSQAKRYEDMTLEEFVNLPNIVDFNTLDDKVFRQYVNGRAYIKIGAKLQGGYVIAYAPMDRIARIFLDLGQYFNNIYPYPLGLMDRVSLGDAGITNVHNTPNVNLRGSGVLVAIVDTGIDYTKAAFRYEDGSSKIQYIWDQTISGKPPRGQYMGTEYSKEDIDRALVSENPFTVVPHRDESGHGTFLASVAAGREDNDYLGAAPDSDIIMVKVRKARDFYIDYFALSKKNQDIYQSTDVMLGIDYILQKALKMNRPVAICIGMGTSASSHDGSSIFEQYLYGLSGETGLALCVPAGNEANARHHFKGSIAKEGDSSEFQLNVGDNTAGFLANVVTSPHDRMHISITSPTGDSISRIPMNIGEVFEKKLTLENSVVRVIYFLGENNIIVVTVTAPTKGVWTINLYGEIILDGVFHSWLSLPQFIDGSVEFLTPDPNFTVVCPATAVGPVTCGAYNSRDGSLYISSSWGPSRNNMMVPDLVAPGVNVGGVTPTGYGVMSGTSVAAAITCGASAIVLQWSIIQGNYPNMNTLRMRTFLVRGCERNPALTFPNTKWGYGKLNLMNAFNVRKRL